jgi:flagellar basal-body rod modification protein FlgD
MESGGTVTGAIEAPKGISSIKVIVKDANDTEVRSFDLKDVKEGFNDFTWDGLTNSGAAAPTGEYTFSTVATASGETGSLETMLSSKVSSVTIDPSSSALTLNTSTGAVTLADVRRVL